MRRNEIHMDRTITTVIAATIVASLVRLAESERSQES